MTRILIREGSEPWVSGFFFKAVVQAVLLFGSDTCLVIPRMGMSLGGFQDHVKRQLMGQIPQNKTDGKWEYTLAAAVAAR